MAAGSCACGMEACRVRRLARAARGDQRPVWEGSLGGSTALILALFNAMTA